MIFLGWTTVRVSRVVRVPWPYTRIIRNNFGYCGLEPKLEFGFFGLGLFGFGLGFFGYEFRVSGILPTHNYPLHTVSVNTEGKILPKFRYSILCSACWQIIYLEKRFKGS